jgi:hypothetical protein
MADHSSPEELPYRGGRRPKTSDWGPHIQYDQVPTTEMVVKLEQALRGLASVSEQVSRVASPGVRAYSLAKEDALGPPEAYLDDHEFCHVHATGAVHLTVPMAVRELVIERGWAEQHIMAKAGSIAPTVVFVYAPRDQNELNAVLWIVGQSYEFARGVGVQIQ